MADKPTGRAARGTPDAAQAEQPRDEFTGKPGRYVRDPQTGVRTPATPRPASAPAADQPAQGQ